MIMLMMVVLKQHQRCSDSPQQYCADHNKHKARLSPQLACSSQQCRWQTAQPRDGCTLQLHTYTANSQDINDNTPPDNYFPTPALHMPNTRNASSWFWTSNMQLAINTWASWRYPLSCSQLTAACLTKEPTTDIQRLQVQCTLHATKNTQQRHSGIAPVTSSHTIQQSEPQWHWPYCDAVQHKNACAEHTCTANPSYGQVQTPKVNAWPKQAQLREAALRQMVGCC
jgi:hypothetical protein